MFNIEEHRHNYHYDMYTVVSDVLTKDVCDRLMARMNGLIQQNRPIMVDHGGLGGPEELDAGGRYKHHLFDGDAIRECFPELVGLYHGLQHEIALITSQDVVLSPHLASDINIKAYPPHGGTLGAHFDTNGITVLIYLTTNTEGALRMDIPRDDPWNGKSIEKRELLAEAGSMLVMQGRKVWHDSAPMDKEFKAVAVLNYYWRGNTRRPAHFDNFVYHGEAPAGKMQQAA